MSTSDTPRPDTLTYRMVKVHGKRVPVSVEGEEFGTVPLLLCNGIGLDTPIWGSFRRLLKRTTIALDVDGWQLGLVPTFRTYARFLDDLLLALGHERVDVLGVSWGGMAAQQLMLSYPQRVRRAVLAATTPGLGGLPANPSVYLYLLGSTRTAERTRRNAAKVYGGDMRDDADLPQKLGLVRQLDTGTYRRQVLTPSGWTSVPFLRRVGQPVLIIHGDDDPICPYINARLMASLIHNAELVTMPRGGHAFLLTRAEESARLVNTFLEERE